MGRRQRSEMIKYTRALQTARTAAQEYQADHLYGASPQDLAWTRHKAERAGGVCQRMQLRQQTRWEGRLLNWGTVGRLLDEWEREERLGQHAYPADGSARRETPAEYWLSETWAAAQRAHAAAGGRGPVNGPEVMRRLGARPGDSRVQLWVEGQLDDDRRERAAAMASAELPREPAAEDLSADMEAGR